jgi:hypothetical protein
MKVAINDAGSIKGLPAANSKRGREFAAELSAFLIWFAEVEGLGHGHSVLALFCLPKSRTQMGVNFARYAPKYAAFGLSAPPQWMWTGPPRPVAGDPVPEYFRLAIQPKLTRYGKISEPLWLMAHTVDAQFSSEEEARIQADLHSTDHPFERVFVLHRDKARQIHPPSDDPSTAPPSERGWVVLAHERMPQVDDERWVIIEP